MFKYTKVDVQFVLDCRFPTRKPYTWHRTSGITEILCRGDEDVWHSKARENNGFSLRLIFDLRDTMENISKSKKKKPFSFLQLLRTDKGLTFCPIRIRTRKNKDSLFGRICMDPQDLRATRRLVFHAMVSNAGEEDHAERTGAVAGAVNDMAAGELKEGIPGGL